MKKRKEIGIDRWIALLFLLAFSCSVVAAQPTKNSFQFKKKLQEADDFFEMEDYKSAETLYLSIISDDSLNEEINLNIAICKFKLKQFPDEILPYLLKAEKSSFANAQLYLGKTYHLACRFDEAIAHYNRYKSFDEKSREENNEEVNRFIQMSILAKSEMQQPHKALIKNVGAAINTKYPEYVPLISADETKLFFTSRRPGSVGGETDVLGNYNEDVYVSYKENGTWTTPENIGSPVNTEKHDACVSLSPDAQQMLIFRTSEDLSSGDLYSTFWNGKNWGEPVVLGKEINSEFKELSACNNNDNTMIIFTSDRPGGFGGKDLYRIVTLPNGKWSAPQNLGPSINTKYDEDAPFFSANGQYLYFSSNGINTIGGYDIFKADAFADFTFGEPQNLGYPINSVGDDIFFVISADRKHGYFSSLNEEKTDPNYLSDDIFLIDMRYGENETCIKKGHCVFDKKQEQPVQVLVSVYDEVTQKVIGTYKPNSSGSFIFTVNPYDKYKIIAEAKGYQTLTIPFIPLVEQEDYEVEVDLLTLEFKTLDN